MVFLLLNFNFLLLLLAPLLENSLNTRANGNTEPPSKCIAEADLEGSGDSPPSPDCVRSVTSIPVVDCKQSKYGCCPDGWTDATGPNGDGCDVDGSGDGGAGGGLVTTISSIVTGILNKVTETLATDRSPVLWPETDDCNLTEFGCCPNGRTKATGPRYYGCTCEDCEYIWHFILNTFLTYLSFYRRPLRLLPGRLHARRRGQLRRLPVRPHALRLLSGRGDARHRA